MNTFRNTDLLSLLIKEIPIKEILIKEILIKEIDRGASDEVGSECADIGTSRRANRDRANAHCRGSATGNMGHPSDGSHRAPPACSRSSHTQVYKYQAP
ncbi:hypothetical protein HYQ46_011281 [Verticillium longisporum]|nr:hypothetical protein HYQ46_011281 [Verticillium longisporum]